MSAFTISRREFLASTSVLAVHVIADRPLALAQTANALPGSLAANPALDMWVQIGADGTVSIATGKCEIGQGIGTALAQIAADELDVELDRISVNTPDTAVSPNEGSTVGSLSIQQSGSAIRIAAAEARGILMANAARELNVEPDQLEVTDGEIRARNSRQSVSYWQLLGESGFDADVTGAFPPKSPEQHRYVGQPVRRFDLTAKFFGEAAYLQDLRLPGMLHARIVRPPVPPARLLRIDAAPVEALPGVIAVVRNGSFLAVVAEREEQAIGAAEELRSRSEWEQAENLPSPDAFPDLLQSLNTVREVIFEQGDQAAAGGEARSISAEYSRPYIAHASISPSAALARYDDGELTVWSHTQGVFNLRGALATMLELPQARVRCIHMPASGCYGHNGADDAACDAAMIAMALPGRSIRLQWSRHDEFQYEPYGSPMKLRVAAQLDSSDRIASWSYDLWSCTHSTRPAGDAAAGNMLAAREKTNPMREPPRNNMRQPTGGGDRNSVALYAFPYQRVTKHFVTDHPLRVSALRGLGAYGNVFAIESFIDELALAANAKPIEFRLQHLEDPRAVAVLETLNEQLAAADELAPASEHGSIGRGIAFARYKNLGAYLAIAIDIEVDRQSGDIAARRATAVVDAGQVINPDGVRNQVEGGIVQATSWTLKEAVSFSADGISSIDWARYPILRFSQVPEIEVTLLNRPQLPALGVGEVAHGPVGAAIANALAAATDIRLRQLPLTPQRVQAALTA